MTRAHDGRGKCAPSRNRRHVHPRRAPLGGLKGNQPGISQNPYAAPSPAFAPDPLEVQPTGDLFAPTLTSRFVGRVIDNFVGGFTGAVAVIVVIAALRTANVPIPNAALFPLAVLFRYALEAIMTAATGKSIGKIATRNRLVRLDGSAVGPLRAVVRTYAVAVTLVSLVVLALENPDAGDPFVLLAGVIAMLEFAVTVVTGRAIGDYVAGTHVRSEPKPERTA